MAIRIVLGFFLIIAGHAIGAENGSKKGEKRPYKWVNVTPKAQFAPRDGAGAIVHDGAMWLLGGWNPSDKKNFPMTCNNEVWRSTDGKDWTLVKPNTWVGGFKAGKDWEGRHTTGFVSFKKKMWIVGGDAYMGRYTSDVWCSADGKSWKQVAENPKTAWPPRVLHYTVAFKGHLWVMGGQVLSQYIAGKEAVYNDVWRSPDGVKWEKMETKVEMWSPRGMIGGSVVFKDRMWVLGGGCYTKPKPPAKSYNNDVWSSADGIHWTCHVKKAPWYQRRYHEVAAFDGRMWVLEGWYWQGGNRNDVWYSSDGVKWTELPNTPWKPRHAASVFVHDDSLWMVTGNNMESDVWRLVRQK